MPERLVNLGGRINRNLYQVLLIMTDMPIRASGMGIIFRGMSMSLLRAKTAMIADVAVRFEDAIGKPVVGHELPDIFHGIDVRVILAAMARAPRPQAHTAAQ